MSNGSGIVVPIRGDGSHIDDAVHPHQLMNAYLPPSTRRLPGELDVKVIQAILRSTTGSDIAVTDRIGSHISTVSAAMTGVSTPSLSNGSFDTHNPDDPDFYWTTGGAVTVDGGQAVLREDDAALGRLSQMFVIPAGAEKLQFTVESLNLNENVSVAADALDVARLDANSMMLVRTVTGLAESDGLFNIQQSGEVYFAPEVTVPGVSNSGDFVELALPLTVEVDLTNVTPGTQATLYFDLLGFGDATSSVTIDDVKLMGNLPPTLSFTLDPSSNSGLGGDGLTNAEMVNFVGSTDPDQEVLLDVDGDGFDDGSVTADSGGAFRFENLMLQEGSNSFLTIVGVDIDRVELLGGDLVRYYYGDDGDQLSSGSIEVTLVAGAVADLAGNLSMETVSTFVYADVQPEIMVTVDGQDVPDDPDTTLSLGAGTQGEVEVSRTFTVTNVGPGELTLGKLDIPERFALSGPTQTQLAMGESTTFTVTLPASNPGTFGGLVTFDNNDTDEAPFGFRVEADIAAATLPPLSVQLDPATDSGTPGDEFTSFSPVNLIGSTRPRQQIFLDTDGDGFDDGTVTADETGQFRFDSIPLGEGMTEIEIQTPSVAGVAELKQTFTIDTQPASATLAVPTTAQIVDDGPGYVELLWSDVGGAGPDAASYDAADITISGVTVDRAEAIGDGLVRYWYDEDDDALPLGEIQVVQVGGQVSDRAGNANVELSHYFARLNTACLWNNPINEFDSTGDSLVTSFDVLFIINELNGRNLIDEDNRLPQPRIPGLSAPPFYDVNCDGLATPFDALFVINELNSPPAPEGELVIDLALQSREQQLSESPSDDDRVVAAAAVESVELFPLASSHKPTRRESYFAGRASADVELLDAIDLDQLAADLSRASN